MMARRLVCSELLILPSLGKVNHSLTMINNSDWYVHSNLRFFDLASFGGPQNLPANRSDRPPSLWSFSDRDIERHYSEILVHEGIPRGATVRLGHAWRSD